MAAFSSAEYSTTSYERYRPSYPESLYTETLIPYHQGKRGLLLDLGCGPGTVTRPLSVHFEKTIGLDPSTKFLQTAASFTPPDKFPGVSYRHGVCEDLEFLKDGEVDMVVAAQAVHWFDRPKWWGEMARVVRPGGTVAVWGYKDALLPTMPKATAVLKRYSHETGLLGEHWKQPARSIVEGRLRAVRPPKEQWDNIERWETEPEFEVAVDEETDRASRKPPVREPREEEGEDREEMGKWVKGNEGMLRCEWTLEEVEEYVRTWSAVHHWKEANPQRRRKKEGGEGDIVDEMMVKMAEAEGLGQNWSGVKTVIAWGHGVVMARRK